MQGGNLFRCLPGCRSRQSLAPRATSVVAAFVNDSAATVPFWINAEHRLAILQQHSGRVPEILAVLTIDHHLPRRVSIQIDKGNRISTRWPTHRRRSIRIRLGIRFQQGFQSSCIGNITVIDWAIDEFVLGTIPDPHITISKQCFDPL